ncbi:hypothetical protein [Streptomyces sp. NBC_00145]|uniref:hypothetical protein n=1 Tax=Streptomyces sp. NBC_00145 TaxID=2975666 RepID=UPI002E16F497
MAIGEYFQARGQDPRVIRFGQPRELVDRLAARLQASFIAEHHGAREAWGGWTPARRQGHYRRCRDECSDWHASALRNLFNRMIGQLYHCLPNGDRYEEALAFPPPPEAAGSVAA